MLLFKLGVASVHFEQGARDLGSLTLEFSGTGDWDKAVGFRHEGSLSEEAQRGEQWLEARGRGRRASENAKRWLRWIAEK